MGSGNAPVVIGGCLVFRCKYIRSVHPDTLISRSAGGCNPHVQQHVRRGVPAHIQPVVHRFAVVVEHVVPGRGRQSVRAPAVRPDGGAVLQEFVLPALDGVTAQYAFMQELDVGQVHQVVGNQFIVAVHLNHALHGRIIGVSVATEIRDGGRVGQRGIAHPYP